MELQLGGLIGYVSAAIAAGLAWLYGRRVQAAQQAIEALTIERDGLMSKEKRHTDALRVAQEELAGLRQAAAKADRRELGLRSKAAELAAEEIVRRTALEKQLAKALDQVEHYFSQTKAMTEQLAELHNERRDIRVSWEKRLEEGEAKAKARCEELENTIKGLKRQVRELSSQGASAQEKLKAVQGKLEDIDPQALQRAKSRVHQYHHLYQLMRGHKEMAEERNRNWELALRILSGWILNKKDLEIPQEQSLGSLVSAALESIQHGPLIDDDEMEEPTDALALDAPDDGFTDGLMNSATPAALLTEAAVPSSPNS